MLKIIKNIFIVTNISKKNLIFNVFGIVFLIMLELASVGSLFPLLTSLINPKSEYDFLSNYFKIFQKEEKIFFFTFFLFAIFLLKNTYIFVFNFYQKKFSIHKQKYLVKKIFENHAFYNAKRQIELSKILRNINYGNSISNWLVSSFQIIAEFLLIIFLILFLFFINFNATLIILLFCSIFLIIYRKVFNNRIKEWSKENVFYSNENYNSQLETFTGLREITVFGKLSFFKKKFLETLDQLLIRGFRVSILEILPRIALEIIFIAGFLSLTIYFYYLFKTPEEIIPTLGVYFFTSLRIFPAFTKIIILSNVLSYANSPIKVLKDISFDKEQDYKEKFFIDDVNEIKFKNVNFKYKNNLILSNCNFKFKKNLFYMLIGNSGIGKTTILNLLMGLLKPLNGEVLINKYNLRYCLKSFRNKIGLVSQEVFIMRATIMENVALGIEKNNIDRLKVTKCLSLARLKNFINSKKEKLEFIIDSNGKNISSGQRQRIGIARALYNNPSVLFLDEPTSSLDESTSKDFIQTLKKLSKNRIIIMITHNTKNLVYSDQVISLDKKKLLVK